MDAHIAVLTLNTEHLLLVQKQLLYLLLLTRY